VYATAPQESMCPLNMRWRPRNVDVLRALLGQKTPSLSDELLGIWSVQRYET
jgi:hypothetical protein